MDALDALDAGSYLVEFLSTIDNLPSEMHFLLNELKMKDSELQALLNKVRSRQARFYTILASNQTPPPMSSPIEPVTKEPRFTPEELSMREKIKRDLKKAEQLAEEKSAIASRAKDLLDRHLKRLDTDLESLYPQHNLTAVSAASTPTRGGTPQPSYTGPISLKKHSTLNMGANTPTPGTFPRSSSGTELIVDRSRPMPTLAGFPPKRPFPDRPHSPSHRTLANIKLSDPNATLSHLTTTAGIPDGDAVTVGEDEERYCYCDGVSNGVMIACDNENCPTEWFHLECVGLDHPPEGKWYCRNCAMADGGDSDKMDKKRKRGRPVGS